MEKLVQVKLREAGQALLYRLSEAAVKIGDYVIVEADRGTDYGHIIADTNECVDAKTQDEPVRKIIRLASSDDLKQIDENKLKAKEDFAQCFKKIQEHKLDMKLVDCEYSFDRSKIIFFFTADGRVDFRELVKDLAKIFKARIELRQIGVRDEAKLLGGFGVCGRRLCCATFLKDFEPVMIKMAKEQGLPLNPPKISGTCGRLMCCLAYEYGAYMELSKGLPKEGDSISRGDGKAKVISVNKLKRSCLIEYEDGRQIRLDYSQNHSCCHQAKPHDEK